LILSHKVAGLELNFSKSIGGALVQVLGLVV
jgi:hypothetical protein